MRSANLGIAVLFACLALCLAGVSFGQDDSADAKPPAKPSATEIAKRLIDEPTGEFVSMPTSELKVRLAPVPKSDLEKRAAEALGVLQKVSEAMADAIVELQRLDGAKADAPELTAAASKAGELREVKAAVITRVNVVLDALEEKGGDVAAGRAYVVVAENLEPGSGATKDDKKDLTPEEKAKQELKARVAAAVATVRDMPPVHERPDPWTVDVHELELELQPLRKEQIQERIEKWLLILQRAVRERVRLDIALSMSEDDAERQEMADLSAKQQEVIHAIVERTQVALLLFQKRGGDPTEYEDYIRHATGQKLNLSDPSVLYAQVVSWLRSAEGGVKIGLNILKFIGVLIGFWLLSRFVGKIVGAAVKRLPKASDLLQRFLVGGTRRLILLIGLVVAVSMLGINITPLVAAIGAAGLVIGLALQGTLSNFASGILILVYRPFDVGDVISGGGVTGKVDAMNLVSTRILTFDNQIMFVPNNEIWNGVITNITGRSTRRVDMTFGIGYGDDIAAAQAIIEKTISEHELVLDDPEPVVRVHELGDNSVNFVVRPWTKTSDYWNVFWDLTRTIKERFDAEGINIPYPQRDLHLPGPIEVMLKSNGSGSAQPAMAGAGAAAPQTRIDEPGPAEDDD